MSARRVYTFYPEINRRKSFRRGFTPILIILIILGSLAAGVGLIFAFQKNSTKTPAEIPRKPEITYTSPSPTASASPSPSPMDKTTNWKTYTNSKFKYAVTYPTRITLSEDINEDYVHFKTPSGDGVKIFAGDLQTDPKLRQDITKLLNSPIGFQDVQEGKTIIRTVKKLAQFDLAGEQAVKIEVTEKSEEVTVYGIGVYVIKDNFAYAIVTEDATDTSRKEESIKILNQILSTFKFIN